MDDLNEKAQRIGQAIYAAEQAQQAGAGGGEYAAPEGGAAPSDDDDVGTPRSWTRTRPSDGCTP
jgi:hypothetical protein